MLILQKCLADAGLIKHTYTGSMHRMLRFLTVEIDIKITTDAHVITNYPHYHLHLCILYLSWSPQLR